MREASVLLLSIESLWDLLLRLEVDLVEVGLVVEEEGNLEEKELRLELEVSSLLLEESSLESGLETKRPVFERRSLRSCKWTNLHDSLPVEGSLNLYGKDLFHSPNK